ncbi:hypothetical protein [Bacillus sp. FJAT-27251]|uniref:hypothetical protein n=1 Tax=Bacillus sp. FJAT-27251 TaxID=1684142 RepID=UPI0006A7997C|nr:hypothetical protein [Bacillus sp. FJAT-27251]
MIKGSKGMSGGKKVRVIISLVSCFILIIWGIYRLIFGNPTSLFIPAIIAFGGLIGLIGGIGELKKVS